MFPPKIIPYTLSRCGLSYQAVLAAFSLLLSTTNEEEPLSSTKEERRKRLPERERNGLEDVQKDLRLILHLNGCVSFFCTKEGGGKREEQSVGERGESMKAKKNTRQPSRADATGERRTARRPGDDPMEERAPTRDIGRDRGGGG